MEFQQNSRIEFPGEFHIAIAENPRIVLSVFGRDNLLDRCWEPMLSYRLFGARVTLDCFVTRSRKFNPRPGVVQFQSELEIAKSRSSFHVYIVYI